MIDDRDGVARLGGAADELPAVVLVFSDEGGRIRRYFLIFAVGAGNDDALGGGFFEFPLRPKSRHRHALVDEFVQHEPIEALVRAHDDAANIILVIFDFQFGGRVFRVPTIEFVGDHLALLLGGLDGSGGVGVILPGIAEGGADDAEEQGGGRRGCPRLLSSDHALELDFLRQQIGLQLGLFQPLQGESVGHAETEHVLRKSRRRQHTIAGQSLQLGELVNFQL